MKTRKALIKRFKVTKTGKILRRPTGQDHLRRKKTGERKRLNRRWLRLSSAETKRIKRLIKK